MVKKMRRAISVETKNCVKSEEKAKMAVRMNLHKKSRPANIRYLSLKTPWKESMSGRSFRIGQMVTLFSDSDAFALHFTLPLIFHSSGYDISSNGGEMEKRRSTITAGMAYGR
jgi:hypothetical protein